MKKKCQSISAFKLHVEIKNHENQQQAIAIYDETVLLKASIDQLKKKREKNINHKY